MSWLRFRRWKNWQRWKGSQGPVGLNQETWEVVRLMDYAQLPGGHWLLKRPLTLPGSTQDLYLISRVEKF